MSVGLRISLFSLVFIAPISLLYASEAKDMDGTSKTTTSHTTDHPPHDHHNNDHVKKLNESNQRRKNKKSN